MINMLRSWKGSVEINGVSYDSIDAFLATGTALSGEITIKLNPVRIARQETKAVNTIEETPAKSAEYKITVKQYMTQKSEPGFDFMAKWNNDNPMPLRTMVGTVEKETRGMVYMKLHGQGEPVIRCMRCGKSLTNPISRHYGIGPECMCKLGIVANIDEVDVIKKQLADVTWEGWIIKSAITEQEAI